MGEQHYPLDFTPQSPYFNWMLQHLAGWQFGEQGLIPAILDAMDCTDGLRIEYGAGDGESLPLTIDRLYQAGGQFWLAETDGGRRTLLEAKYPKAIVEYCIHWDDVVKRCRFIDVVVIDIDGSDSVVMREMLQAGVRPALLVVEHFDRNYPIATSFPDPIPQWMLGIKTESGHTIQDTAETLHAIAGKFGYERIGFNRCNSFFVRRELLATLFGKGEP